MLILSNTCSCIMFYKPLTRCLFFFSLSMFCPYRSKTLVKKFRDALGGSKKVSEYTSELFYLSPDDMEIKLQAWREESHMKLTIAGQPSSFNPSASSSMASSASSSASSSLASSMSSSTVFDDSSAVVMPSSLLGNVEQEVTCYVHEWWNEQQPCEKKERERLEQEMHQNMVLGVRALLSSTLSTSLFSGEEVNETEQKMRIKSLCRTMHMSLILSDSTMERSEISALFRYVSERALEDRFASELEEEEDERVREKTGFTPLRKKSRSTGDSSTSSLKRSRDKSFD